MQLPTCSIASPGPEYLFGIFIHGGNSDPDASNRLWTSSAELFREEVRGGLQDWWNTCVIAVNEPRPTPGFALAAPHPNPTQGAVTLRYTLPHATAVRLTVHDVAGREVARLVQGIKGPGELRVSWDTQDDNGHILPTGLYFLRLQAGGQIRTAKLVVQH